MSHDVCLTLGKAGGWGGPKIFENARDGIFRDGITYSICQSYFFNCLSSLDNGKNSHLRHFHCNDTNAFAIAILHDAFLLQD